MSSSYGELFLHLLFVPQIVFRFVVGFVPEVGGPWARTRFVALGRDIYFPRGIDKWRKDRMSPAQLKYYKSAVHFVIEFAIAIA